MNLAASDNGVLGTRTSLDQTIRAARVLQKALDRLGENGREGLGILGRNVDQLIPGMSFWAYRALHAAWGALEGAWDGRMDVARERLHRAIELTNELGPTGELCLACIKNVGEEEAAQADLQLVNGVQWEPVPICRNCETQAREIWGVEGVAELEPLTPVWPPWSIPPTWSIRQPDVFSHDRFGYAAWQKALEGDVDGMYLAAMCYEVGVGLQRSVEAAAHWYQMAEQTGYPGAASGVERCKRRGPWKRETKEAKEFWKH